MPKADENAEHDGDNRLAEAILTSDQVQDNSSPVAQTVERNIGVGGYNNKIAVNVTALDSDKFYVSMISYPNGFKKGEEPEKHTYLLPSSLLQPYRSEIDRRIEEVGDYTAMAIVNPSCHEIGVVIVSLMPPGQATPPVADSQPPCAVCLCPMMCLCCLLSPVVCLGCCFYSCTLQCCPGSLVCCNCCSSCCCPGTILVNSRLVGAVMKHMKENGGREAFEVASTELPSSTTNPVPLSTTRRDAFE